MGIKEDKQRFLSALDEEKQIFFAHIYDLSLKADKYGCALFGDFLSENELALLDNRNHLLPILPTFFGGFEDAERKMISFIPEGISVDFPISAVKITSKDSSRLTHRDYLGSILGLGIKREKCGDIIINGNECFAFFEKEIALFVNNSLCKVGSFSVSTSIVSLDECLIPEKKTVMLKGTVASLRLDAVLSLFIGKGRSQTLPYINSGRVFVNGLIVEKPDFHLSDGAVISVRGVGKGTLTVGGNSKKDRIFITLNKFV